MDIGVPVRRAGLDTELRLRVVIKPESATAQRLAHLAKGIREISTAVLKII